MERRTYESPMDWEYQTQGPMDPTSPFVRSIQNAQKTSKHAVAPPSSPVSYPHSPLTMQTTDTAFGAARPGALAANSTPNLFARSQTNSPSKPPPASSNRYDAPAASTPSSSSGHPLFQRTNTAPPFRNPAFTTPRKPFDMDPVSEVEDSPAATDADASDFLDPDTPEDNSRSLRHMSLTPARSKALLQQATRRSPGKGEIANPRTMFGNRDKIRKRKRRHDDKDISGYRLPYKHVNEWEESEDPDSDDSTYEPNEHPNSRKSQRGGRGNAPAKKGWFAGFLATISKHPSAPQILGYWLTLAFNASILGFALYILLNIYSAFRHEMSLISLTERTSVNDEIAKCIANYDENRCSPKEQRVPAINQMCEEWWVCMNQNPERDYNVRFGARNLVEIANTIFESMHWKTMVGILLTFMAANPMTFINNLLQAAFFILTMIFCTSGASLFKTSAPPSFTTAVPHHPQSSQVANGNHEQQHYFYPPRTPHRGSYALMHHMDDTPDTDASPESNVRPQLLPPPYETPGRRRSPSKEHRSRSPTKSRNPSKRY
ncbi:hypothetical protein PG994_005245 [Apiospora phragmitis]|uniref:Brl1/Brr6 domain-containing protein n=1 Tax=Apiospora phragmitis TaxID=2905665 RepID=A0ABR1VVK0_9PEZI